MMFSSSCTHQGWTCFLPGNLFRDHTLLLPPKRQIKANVLSFLWFCTGSWRRDVPTSLRTSVILSSKDNQLHTCTSHKLTLILNPFPIFLSDTSTIRLLWKYTSSVNIFCLQAFQQCLKSYQIKFTLRNEGDEFFLAHVSHHHQNQCDTGQQPTRS